MALDARETWESVTDSAVHFLDIDAHGREVPRSVKRKGQRFSITVGARLHNEGVRPEGPFANGFLKCIEGEKATPDQPGKTDAELMELVERYDPSTLKDLLLEAPKLTVSRLRQMVRSTEYGERFTVGFRAAIDQVWITRWPQRTVPEMQLEGIFEEQSA